MKGSSCSRRKEEMLKQLKPGFPDWKLCSSCCFSLKSSEHSKLFSDFPLGIPACLSEVGEAKTALKRKLIWSWCSVSVGPKTVLPARFLTNDISQHSFVLTNRLCFALIQKCRPAVGVLPGFYFLPACTFSFRLVSLIFSMFPLLLTIFLFSNSSLPFPMCSPGLKTCFLVLLRE